MKKRICIQFACVMLLFISLEAQTAHKYLRKGDNNYIDGDMALAEESYRKALEADPKATKGSYNLGNTVYTQERFDEAIEIYEDAAKRATDDELRGNALHNLGNAYFGKQDFENAVKSYKEALRIDPNDEDTRQNLVMSLKQLQAQQQEQQQDSQGEEGEENQDQEQEDQQQNEQDQKEKQEDQQEKQENQESDQKEEGEKENQKPAEEELENLSEEDAKALLQIMENEEKKVQEKLRKATARPNKSSKDW